MTSHKVISINVKFVSGLPHDSDLRTGRSPLISKRRPEQNFGLCKISISGCCASPGKKFNNLLFRFLTIDNCISL